jgi:hypothetical protein
MLRSDCIAAIQSFLQENYTGPISILRNEDEADLNPPYALVRIGSGEDIGLGQYNLWDFNVIIAVFHDADETTIETAEAGAATLFAALADSAVVMSYLRTKGIVPSAWESLTSEAGQAGNNWQHFHGFQLIASPAATD